MMFEISPHDIIHIGRRSPGGDDFTRFVDSIITSELSFDNIPISNLNTNQRTNKRDGGVDTKVDISVPDRLTEWLNEKTIWQYKSTEQNKISEKDLRDEIKKDYVKKCLDDGFHYRLCVCDEITPETKEKWERILNEEIKEINPNNIHAKILSAGDLANWANFYPGISLKYKFNNVEGIQTFESWEQNVTKEVKHYVEIEEYSEIKGKIKNHIDFNSHPVELCLSVFGAPGTGKTRFVYESVKDPSIKNMIVYCQDSKIENVLRALTHFTESRAIIIADECSPDIIYSIRTRYPALINRVRVITIDNSETKSNNISPEYFLKKIPNDIINKILEKNFSLIPADRRIKYANLSAGFIRLAVDICNHDSDIVANGNYNPVFENINQYYVRRLDKEEREAVEILALLMRTGFKDDVSVEIDELCKLFSFNKETLLKTAMSLKDKTGFINIGGRYLYVTPDIIAKVAFKKAWDRWFLYEYESILFKMPAGLLASFLKRVSSSAPEDVRKTIADCFSKLMLDFKIENLKNLPETKFFLEILKSDVDSYLPYLRTLIDHASIEDLREVSGAYSLDWGPRRQIISLLEELKSYPDYFYDAEKILFRLALSENEKNIGNNATHVWKSCFDIFTSGTSIPFKDKFDILKRRIFSENNDESSLAFSVLSKIMYTGGVRFIGHKSYINKMPPHEWQPKTQIELKECYDLIIDVVKTAVGKNLFEKEAFDFVLAEFSILIDSGYLDEIIGIFTSLKMDIDEKKLKIIAAINKYEEYGEFKKYKSQLSIFKKTLLGDDLHAHVLNIVGIPSFDISNDGEWKKQLQELAAELLANPQGLTNEMKWLYSTDAKDAWQLGNEIGKLDDGSFIDKIIDINYISNYFDFAKGYVSGIVYKDESNWEKIIQKIKNIENKNAVISFNLYLAGEEKINGFSHCFDLIKKSKVNINFITELFRYLYWVNIDINSLTDFFDYSLNVLSKEMNIDILNAFLRLLYQLLRNSKVILREKKVLDIILKTVELCNNDFAYIDTYCLVFIMGELLDIIPEKSASFLIEWLVSDSIGVHDEAQKTLIKYINGNEIIFLEKLKSLLDNEKNRIVFSIGRYRHLVSAFPPSYMESFIDSLDIKSKRVIARHLPSPYLKNGEKIVPEITLYTLEKYGNDDELFNEFCMGIHSMQMYCGDISEEHRKEAEIAKKFFSHPSEVIRKWAQVENERSLHQAKHWKQIEDEMF